MSCGPILAVVISTLALMFLYTNSAKPDALQVATSNIVGAANAFLSSLSDKQRAALLYKFDDDNQRARWSNFPTGFVPRGGLSLKELTDTRKKAALALVGETLSKQGFEKVEEIREADDVFKYTPHEHPSFGNHADSGPGHPPPGMLPPGGPPDGGPGRPPLSGFHGGRPEGEMFGKDLYYISFLGTPSEKDPWMLQFGGHHLNVIQVPPQGDLPLQRSRRRPPEQLSGLRRVGENEIFLGVTTKLPRYSVCPAAIRWLRRFGKPRPTTFKL